MSPLQEPPSISVDHLREARMFVDAADLLVNAQLYKPAASCCSLGAIRACDAVCVAERGEHHSGANHNATADILRQTSLGDAAADVFLDLLQEKNNYQYYLFHVSREEAQELLDKLHGFYASVEEAVRRKFPVEDPGMEAESASSDADPVS